MDSSVQGHGCVLSRQQRATAHGRVQPPERRVHLGRKIDTPRTRVGSQHKRGPKLIPQCTNSGPVRERMANLVAACTSVTNASILSHSCIRTTYSGVGRQETLFIGARL